MEIAEVLVPLSSLEAKNYKKFLIRARLAAANPAARLAWDQVTRQNFQNSFADIFKNLRLSCSWPPWVVNSDAADCYDRFMEGSYGIYNLYDSKRLNEHRCSICGEPVGNDCVDFICTNGLIFCEDLCLQVIIRNINIQPELLYSLSSKSKWVIRKIQEHINGQNFSSSKILVLSSCQGTLSWLMEALDGLGVESTICLSDRQMHMPTFIDHFISSLTRIMLMTIDSLQLEIKLPSYSCVVVTEAVVSDVAMHIFERLKTVKFDETLSRYVLIAADTVEEIIYDEPPFPDRYNSYDEHGKFIGPQFTDLEKIVSLVDRSPNFDVVDDYRPGLADGSDYDVMMRIREIRAGRIEEVEDHGDDEGQGMEEDDDDEGQGMEEDDDDEGQGMEEDDDDEGEGGGGIN